MQIHVLKFFLNSSIQDLTLSPNLLLVLSKDKLEGEKSLNLMEATFTRKYKNEWGHEVRKERKDLK